MIHARQGAADFYLASASPRRRELLLQIGARFDVLDVGAGSDESQHLGEPAATYVERVAAEKARRGLALARARDLPGLPVLAADTVVIVEGDVLGKPRDADEAAAFLARLSGRAHEVRTAVVLALHAGGAFERFLAETSISAVHFRALSADEIRRYAASAEPYDKAGGYAIQGRAAAFAARIEGSYSGIMGLPLETTARLLAAAGIGLD